MIVIRNMASGFVRLVVLLFISVHQPMSCVSAEKRHGCTSPFSRKERPFRVVWNIPSGFPCDQYDIHLNLRKWGIVTNQNASFFGDQMVIFYGLGDWPYIEKNGNINNGGLPQVSKNQCFQVMSLIGVGGGGGGEG